jgi:hypothetical protein
MSLLPPSPFLNCVDQPGPTQSAAVIATLPPSAAAEPIQVEPDATNCIGEIFHFARKLLARDGRHAEDFIDWQALEQALDEPLPMFIRDGEHLKRWS